MNNYGQFHGNVLIKDIGKELRRIVDIEKGPFKITTGYGSSSGRSKSKEAALKALYKMKKQFLVKGYIPGEVMKMLVDSSSRYYEDKLKFGYIIKKDEDCGNDGVIFVFI